MAKQLLASLLARRRMEKVCMSRDTNIKSAIQPYIRSAASTSAERLALEFKELPYCALADVSSLQGESCALYLLEPSWCVNSSYWLPAEKHVKLCVSYRQIPWLAGNANCLLAGHAAGRTRTPTLIGASASCS